MAHTAETTPLHAYTELAGPFGAVVERLDPADWDQPSPCEGWSARDVLAHVVDTERDFLQGRGLDVGHRPDLGAPSAAWRTTRMPRRSAKAACRRSSHHRRPALR